MRGDTEMHMWISVWEVEIRFFQNARPRLKVHVSMYTVEICRAVMYNTHGAETASDCEAARRVRTRAESITITITITITLTLFMSGQAYMAIMCRN